MRRDGVVLASGGGSGIPVLLRPATDAAGKSAETIWPAPVATLLRQLTRKSIAQRTSIEARFDLAGCGYSACATPRGPDRAVCVIRARDRELNADASDSPHPRPHLDRRGFLRRFKESMSWAALRETPIALAVIHVDGVSDIAQVLASQFSEQVMSAAILRLPAPSSQSTDGRPPWYLGQLSDSLLALVIESADREAVEACVAQICWSLREPIHTGDAEFHLTPYAGVAILGQDASSPKVLLDHARATASEARRSGSAAVHFFSDTVKLHALARLDLARELREAVANGDIRLRYTGRYDLQSGQLVTCVGYLRWAHPLRGEIRPAEFLRVAAATGLAASLSRTVLACLRRDIAQLAARAGADVRVSFGALRHHVLQEDFTSDVSRLIADGVPPERLELRIAEKVFIARAPAHFSILTRLGIRLVIDEVGRGVGSLDALARGPVWGLQLDRAWVAALRNDPIAGRVCRAGVGMATALGLVPIAMGVDEEAIRSSLVEFGCSYGSGDLYPDDFTDIIGRSASQTI